MSWSRLDLGVGLVAAAGTDLLWNEIADLLDVLEVEPQTMWRALPGGGWTLDAAAFNWFADIDRPKLSHGVGFPVGGSVPPDAEGVRLAAASARRLEAVHWSEHLSFNRAARGETAIDAGFLLPPVPRPATVQAAVDNIARYREQSDLPFLIETPASYLRVSASDMTDGDLIAAVSEQADCGILLDLHNVWANELNGRQSVVEFLSEIPLERVWEVHLAGGFELDGYYLDAHCGPVGKPLLELAARVVPILPNVRALVFESVPESLVTLGVEGVRDVLVDLRRIAALPPEPHEALRHRRHPSVSSDARDRDEVAARELELVAHVAHLGEPRQPQDPGADILRGLADHARLSLVAATESERLRWMLERLGRRRANEWLTEYLASSPANMWAAAEGNAFARWFQENEVRMTSEASRSTGA